MTKEIIKKIIIIFILSAILIAGIGVKSFAVDYTCTLTVTPDKTEIKAGESVTLSIQVSDINAGDGIAIFNTTLEYDADVFDLKAQSDSAGIWTSTVIENSLTFTKADYEATSEDQEIGKVILTAKEDATLGEQTITFTNNEFSEATTFSVADVSTTVEIVEGTNGGNDDGNNTSGGNTNTPSGNTNTPSGNTNTPSGNVNGGNGSRNYSNSGVINSGTSNNILPKTGFVQDCLIGAIIVAVIVAVGFYIKYRKAY